MSHQTGIQPNDELKVFATKCKNSGKARVLKVSIKDEQIVLDEHKEPHGKWDEDYERFVHALLLDKQPTYLLFRLDSKNSLGLYEWLLLVWYVV